MLRVDHSYGYPLEMPSVILSERRMYNAKTRTFQAKAKIRANSTDTNITARKVQSNNVRSIAITNELWNLTAGNASVSKEVKFFIALEQRVETRKEDSNDRECIVVTDLLKDPTERKYLRRFIESTRQTGTTKEDFIINLYSKGDGLPRIHKFVKIIVMLTPQQSGRPDASSTFQYSFLGRQYFARGCRVWNNYHLKRIAAFMLSVASALLFLASIVTYPAVQSDPLMMSGLAKYTRKAN
ncbi:hypothetical protein ARMGADRAFT_1033899 [Armillaria gallica]|uniref:Uncharacterized protein n=1 Tax=Armillaria gallica TaxID=47427 RepID=A0A2H3DJU4_ARMGA|nr:hypothetical protein ARMGADRAFT_1033899 [Armillaria gallica]